MKLSLCLFGKMKQLVHYQKYQPQGYVLLLMVLREALTKSPVEGGPVSPQAKPGGCEKLDYQMRSSS